MRCALVFAFCLSLVSAGAQVTRTEGVEGAERVVILENEHLRVVIFPDLGGRIGRLVDRATGDELLYWDLRPEAVYAGLGGALDDRRNSFEPYAYSLPADQPGTVRMTWADQQLSIEKTVTLAPGQATVRVDYAFANTGQVDLKDYEVMTKNFLTPSGGPVSPADLYCLPTTHGVRRIEAFSGSWNYPELGGKFKQNVGPWNAMVSTTRRRAIAVAFSNDYYRWFYMWKSGIEFPTYEWVFGVLPAGQRTSVTLWLHVASGLDGVSHADERVVVNTRHDDGGLTTTLFAATAPLRGADLQTEVQRLPDGAPRQLPTIALPDIPLAASAEANIPWDAQTPGTWVMRQRLVVGGTIVSQWEEPVVIGQPSAQYVRELAFPARAQFTPVPGWQRQEAADIVQPTAQDRKRGFVVYLDEFAAAGQRGRHVTEYLLDMGQGEHKSFGVKVRALRDLQNLAVTVGGDLAGQIELFGVEPVDVSSESSGKTGLIGRKLVPWRSVDLAAGQEAEVWVRVRSEPSDCGPRTAVVTLRARGCGPADLSITARVRAVHLPRPNLISHEAEHQVMGLPGCWDAQQQRWNQEVVEAYCRDLGQHLVDFEQGFWGWFSNPRQPEMVLLPDGRNLKQFKESGAEVDPSVPLDFSYLNPVLDAAIRNGLVRFSTNAGQLPPDPLSAWTMAEAARYLRDRGYPDRDIWCKHLDEQPADRYPQMARDVVWLREHGYRPYSTFHNLLASPDDMSVLNPSFDMYQGGFSTIADRQARLAEGTMDPTDEVWMYQGWGASWYNYAQNRQVGWFVAAAELDGYHVHVYYRWSPTDAIIFPSERGPYSSPAWEAMRDGMADAQYVALARRWLERLQRAAERTPALTPTVERAQQRLRRIIGGENALIRLERKRDRLRWVKRLPELELPTIEQARAQLLDLLEELRPDVEALGPSLYYGWHTLAEDGNVRVFLDPQADPTAAALLEGLMQIRFGVALRNYDPARGDGVVVDLAAGSVPPRWAGCDLHISDRYPGPGEYVIHVEDAAPDQPTRLLIFGRDAAGLAKGVHMWLHFLRPEKPGAVRN